MTGSTLAEDANSAALIDQVPKQEANYTARDGAIGFLTMRGHLNLFAVLAVLIRRYCTPPSNNCWESTGTSFNHNRHIPEDTPVRLRGAEVNEGIMRYRNTSTPRRAVLSIYYRVTGTGAASLDSAIPVSFQEADTGIADPHGLTGGTMYIY